MSTTKFHVCLDQPGAPAADGEVEPLTRWVCECGSSFVFREGFSATGHLVHDWWPAPPLVRPRRMRSGLKGLLPSPRTR